MASWISCKDHSTTDCCPRLLNRILHCSKCKASPFFFIDTSSPQLNRPTPALDRFVLSYAAEPTRAISIVIMLVADLLSFLKGDGADGHRSQSLEGSLVKKLLSFQGSSDESEVEAGEAEDQRRTRDGPGQS